MSVQSRFGSFIAFTCGLVILCGSAATLSVFLTRPAAPAAAERSFTSLGVTASSPVAELDMPCLTVGQRKLSTASGQVRLNGTNCRQDVEDFKILNRTNGYNATIFKNSKGSFSTDYISLEFGENDIVLTQNLKNESSQIYEIMIVRTH